MSTPGSDFEVRVADWLGWEEARARILASAEPLPSELLPAAASLGRALAGALVARATLPPWDNSAMDGYAAVGSDVTTASPSTPVTLEVVAVTHAGDPPASPIREGQAVRVMTGAPVPPGADSVVRVEDTDREDTPGAVRIVRSRDAGRNIRLAGQDMQRGDRVAEAGSAVTPAVCGLLAALGMDTVEVVRSASVAILSTGDELRTPERYDDVIAGAGVPESNGPMLAAAAASAGADPLVSGIAGDDPDELRASLDHAADADVLVTIGGASMGEADLVKRVLDGLGFRQDFWRVRVRPGSPFAFGWLPRGDREQAVFSLPGNPTSAFVTFELFVRPYLLARAGHLHVLRRTLRCTAGETLAGPGELTHFPRVRIEASPTGPVVRTTGSQGSGLMTPLAGAHGLAVVPEDVSEIPEGGSVDVILLDDAPGAGSPP